ncbi:Gfo/Idh/MocA family protein [Gaoshiqia sp. Z1-71]|uniref:Gfo/Idh/MocA family protein n=1 Tax=Gaoshiqia hydrogeniformans TaxID=3290090 RepID=UPI003BF7F79B
MNKIRTAIIGPGKVAHLHAVNLVKSPNADFVAVCGRTLFKAKAFAGVYNIRAYDDLETMIREEKIEVLIVCTPHPYHRDPVVRAAALGVHCLIEKPMASSLQDCDAMLEAAAQNGVSLGVISQRRFYEPVKRMKKAIDEGKIGAPALGSIILLGWRDEAYYSSDPWRGNWETEGGGVLVNQAPHQLDLFQWLMGPIEQVYAVTRNLNHPYIEVEDTALAVVQFKGGAVGSILLSNSQKPGIYGKIHVHGSNGASVGAQTEGGAMFIAGQSSVLEPPVNDLWTVAGEENLLEQWKQEDCDFFNRINAAEYYIGLQIEDFLEAVKTKRQPLVNGEEGRKTVELFTAIYRSDRDQAPVRFPLPRESGSDFDGRMK